MTTWDTIVVGAGPAGSATATLLARGGQRVLLVDRARFPRDKPCSEYLSPGTTPLLERLGVLPAVRAAAPARLRGMKVVAGRDIAMTGYFAHGERDSFALPRTTFDSILRHAAEGAGAEVRESVKVEDLAPGGVLVRTGGGKREKCDAPVVVGADGLRSVVARRLGPVLTSPPRRVAFASHFAAVAGVSDVGEMHVGGPGGAYVGMGPIGDGITTVALVVPAAQVRRLDVPRRYRETLEQFPGLRGRFDRARLVRPILATGPFAQWSRRPVAPDGAALLVGDAADFFDPFTGQGIYSALRGAELAAHCLLSGAPLASYARARRREFGGAGKWLLERLIAVGVGFPTLARRVVGRLAGRPDLADLLVGATGNIVPARRALAPAVLAGLLL